MADLFSVHVDHPEGSEDTKAVVPGAEGFLRPRRQHISSHGGATLPFLH